MHLNTVLSNNPDNNTVLADAALFNKTKHTSTHS